MPISQRTMLTIYGNLCDVLEAVERLHMQASQGELFEATTATAERTRAMVAEAYRIAYRAQRQAIDQILHDEPEIEVNPLTGRLS